MATPDDPIIGSPDACAWAARGDDDFGAEGSVVDATTTSRGTARVEYARLVEFDVPMIGVWKRYARPFTRQEAWDEWGRETFEWEDAPSVDGDDAGPIVPARVPDDWDPGYAVERHATWAFVPRGTPGAWPIWCCGPQRIGPPPSPPTTRAEDRDA